MVGQDLSSVRIRGVFQPHASVWERSLFGLSLLLYSLEMLRDKLNRDTLPILLPSALAVTLMIGGVAVMLVPIMRTYIENLTVLQ